MSGASERLVGELLTESLAAWRIEGDVVRAADDSVAVHFGDKTICVEPAPTGSTFRWVVTIDGRQRPAISLIAVLRQVRQAVDPGYAAGRVRVTVAPLVPQ